jgi:hypothetical protein
MTKEIKVLSLNNLDRWQTDIIMDITRTEVHHWRRNEDGGLDLYYDDMGEPREKKTFIVGSIIAATIIIIGVVATILF